MGILSIFSPISPISNLFKSKKPNQIDQLLASLQPNLNRNTEISNTAFQGSQQDIGAARANYGDLVNYYTKFLTGSRDEQLKNINAGEITAEGDNSNQILSSLGVRGGQRAATLANSDFDREALLNSILQMHREQAGDHLKALSDAFASLGMGELSASFTANQSNPQILQAIQQLREHEKDRKYALIGSIIAAAGSAAGAAAGA